MITPAASFDLHSPLNAVDASLWYVDAVHDFLEPAPLDAAVRHRLGAAVQAILDGYAAGTRFAIAAAADGLLPALRFFEPLLAHLQTAGLGHVSEVADGDPPHRSGGCPFQAWSVSELIRIQNMVEPPTRASRQEPQP
jgi:glycogen debranching enzyme